MEPSSGMGQAQRAAQSRHDDPLVSVGDWLDDEESGAWCVDNGAGITVMRTRAIYDAVERGDLSPDMKVWRDGRACWLPIAECYELTVKPKPRPDATPVSGIRRVKRSPVIDDEADAPAETRPKPTVAADRPTLMLTTSFAIGVLIGALLYLPFAW